VGGQKYNPAFARLKLKSSDGGATARFDGNCHVVGLRRSVAVGTGLAAPTISLKTIGGKATRSYLGSSATPRLRRLAAPFELAPSLALFG
jgi:hypothetical protein